MLIDAEEIALGNVNPDLAVVPAAKSALSLEETPDQILIKGDGFTVPFDKSTGLIHNATSRGKVVIEKGPFLNLDLNVNHNTGPEVREKAKNYIVDDADWKKGSLVYRRDSEGAILLDLSGTYKGIGHDDEFYLAAEWGIGYLLPDRGRTERMAPGIWHQVLSARGRIAS